MNILLIGGAGCFIDNIINKLNKEGHRVCLLTGNRFQKLPYQKVFERYDFDYDADCLRDIFESCAPEVVLYMGAFDTNYVWSDDEKTSIHFSNNLTNILMTFAMIKSGRFIFLSSDEVFGDSYEKAISESEKTTPRSLKGLSLAQAEELCRMCREGRNLDVVTVRLDHYYSIPQTRKDAFSRPAQLCMEYLEKGEISYIPNNCYSLLYETDAVEAIYQLVKTKEHRHSVYHISSGQETSDREVIDALEKAAGKKIPTMELALPERKCILSSGWFDTEFGKPRICNFESIIRRVYEKIFKNQYLFLTGKDAKPPFWKRVMDKSGWFLKLLIPFTENIVGFCIFFLLNYFIGDFKYFERLDLFLIYVLLFAVVYGQQQASFSALLATVGYFAVNIMKNSAQSTLFDLEIYVWVAQLFFVGLIVGYLKDQLLAFRSEADEEQDFLNNQLSDIQNINSSNVRVKGALEMQLVNQNDSVGKIFRITSELDQYSPQEVLFYAADVIAKLMETKDVAVYSVSDGPYARLFSSTSQKAKTLGNSIKYEDMGELYECILEHKIFINRKLDGRYPLMANGIFADEQLQVLVFVWGIPWERMTLGQANQFTVGCSLIQGAVIRANRYLGALESERCYPDSRLLYPDAMTILIKSYLDAERRGLADCTVLEIDTGGKDAVEAGLELSGKTRQTDIPGLLDDGHLYILLSNTTREEAKMAIKRLEQFGYPSVVAEEFEI